MQRDRRFIRKIARSNSREGENARAFLRDLQKTYIRTGFFGSFSAGKSSLLAAILGRRFFPIHNLPTTRVPLLIRKGKPGLEIQYKSSEVSGKGRTNPQKNQVRGEARRIELPRPEDFGKQDEQELRDTLDAYSREDAPLHNISHFILTWPLPWLPDYCELMDTPGSNSSSTEGDILPGLRQECDISVFVMHAVQPFSVEDAQILRDLQLKTEKTLVILNKADLIDESEMSARQLVTHVSNQIRNYKGVANLPVYPVAAKLALADRFSRDFMWEDFLADLDTLMVTAGPKMLKRKMRRRIHEEFGNPHNIYRVLRLTGKLSPAGEHENPDNI